MGVPPGENTSPGTLDRTVFVLGISNLSDLPVTDHNVSRGFVVNVTV